MEDEPGGLGGPLVSSVPRGGRPEGQSQRRRSDRSRGWGDARKGPRATGRGASEGWNGRESLQELHPADTAPGGPGTLAPELQGAVCVLLQSGSVICHSSRDSPPPGEELGAGSCGRFRQERDSLICASEIWARDGMATPGPAQSMLTPLWAACGLVSGAPTALLAPPLHRWTD